MQVIDTYPSYVLLSAATAKAKPNKTTILYMLAPTLMVTLSKRQDMRRRDTTYVTFILNNLSNLDLSPAVFTRMPCEILTGYEREDISREFFFLPNERNQDVLKKYF